ncbi:MAG: phosphate ABC transporter permease PstA [Armatimonadota bacterium]
MRKLRDRIFTFTAVSAVILILACLTTILGTIISKGIGAINWQILTQEPKGSFYTGGAGGIANAIVGSLYIGFGATILALLVGLPCVLYLRCWAHGTRLAAVIRGLMDVLWGIPSIVFGAFGFTIMMWLGVRASLLAGTITVALFELPIIIRSIDEVVRMIPRELDETAYALGSTRFETARKVILKQAMPGIVLGTLLAFGRGIGDAASVLFTAGYTDHIPSSIMDPTATLPLAIFFQLGTPFEEVHQRAYAAALVLVVMVLTVSVISRLISARLNRYSVK